MLDDTTAFNAVTILESEPDWYCNCQTCVLTDHVITYYIGWCGYGCCITHAGVFTVIVDVGSWLCLILYSYNIFQPINMQHHQSSSNEPSIWMIDFPLCHDLLIVDSCQYDGCQNLLWNGGGRCKEKVILSQESYMVGSDTWMCNVILSLIVDQPSSWLVLYTKGGCVLSWCHHLSLHMLVDACIYDPSSFFLSLIFLFTFLLRFEWL